MSEMTDAIGRLIGIGKSLPNEDDRKAVGLILERIKPLMDVVFAAGELEAHAGGSAENLARYEKMSDEEMDQAGVETDQRWGQLRHTLKLLKGEESFIVRTWVTVEGPNKPGEQKRVLNFAGKDQKLLFKEDVSCALLERLKGNIEGYFYATMDKSEIVLQGRARMQDW